MFDIQRESNLKTKGSQQHQNQAKCKIMRRSFVIMLICRDCMYKPNLRIISLCLETAENGVAITPKRQLLTLMLAYDLYYNKF